MAKEKKFEDYMKDWRKKQPIKLRADGTPIDNLGVGDGVIRLSAPDPRKRGTHNRLHTRVKKASDPITASIKTKRARKRRKDAVIEI